MENNDLTIIYRNTSNISEHEIKYLIGDIDKQTCDVIILIETFKLLEFNLCAGKLSVLKNFNSIFLSENKNVLVLIKKELNFTLLSSNKLVVTFEIKNYIITAFYFEPVTKEFELILNSLDTYFDDNSRILIGDLNCHLQYQDGEISDRGSGRCISNRAWPNPHFVRLQKFTRKKQLKQLNNFKNSYKNILDVFFTNVKNEISAIKIDDEKLCRIVEHHKKLGMRKSLTLNTL